MKSFFSQPKFSALGELFCAFLTLKQEKRNPVLGVKDLYLGPLKTAEVGQEEGVTTVASGPSEQSLEG